MAGYDTDWPADSVEFCPHPSARDIFVCGTYKLEQTSQDASAQNEDGDGAEDVDVDVPPSRQPQKRRGKALLFRAQDEDK